MGKTDFSVYQTDKTATYTMAYTCDCCGKPAVATGADKTGMFVGRCNAGTSATVMAS